MTIKCTYTFNTMMLRHGVHLDHVCRQVLMCSRFKTDTLRVTKYSKNAIGSKFKRNTKLTSWSIGYQAERELHENVDSVVMWNMHQ